MDVNSELLSKVIDALDSCGIQTELNVVFMVRDIESLIASLFNSAMLDTTIKKKDLIDAFLCEDLAKVSNLECTDTLNTSDFSFRFSAIEAKVVIEHATALEHTEKTSKEIY